MTSTTNTTKNTKACEAKAADGSGWMCTRDAGHTGDHQCKRAGAARAIRTWKQEA